MAATALSKEDRDLDLKPVDEDFDVTHSGSVDSYTVTFTMDGADLLKSQNVLRPRLPAVGVEGITRLGMTMSLYGVEAGRESEVFAELGTAIDEVSKLRSRRVTSASPRNRPPMQPALFAEERLGKVQDGFRIARASRP